METMLSYCTEVGVLKTVVDVKALILRKLI